MSKNKPVDTERLPNTKVLTNGAIYDTDKKRIVGMKAELAERNTQITSANGAEMQAKAVAKKRLVMAQAANRDVAPELIAQYGDYAHVAERAITLQQIATTPEAGKAAVMAHDALVRDMGMSEKALESSQAGPQVDDTIRALGEFAAQIRDLLQSDVIPMRQEITAIEPDE